MSTPAPRENQGTIVGIVMFFSSRRRHTRWNCDWSSDVCSSDLTWLPSLFQNTSTGGAGFTPYDLSQLGITNDGTFSVNFADPLFASNSLGTTEYWYQSVPIYQLSDNVTKIVGRHTFKAGFYWQRRDERDNDVIRSVNIGGDCA